MFDRFNKFFSKNNTHNTQLSCDDVISYKNIEIQAATEQIELLQKYIKTTSVIHKFLISQKFNNIVQHVLKEKLITPDKLIQQIKIAITKDKFRPRNMPICLLALCIQDLENINGEFDTFDSRFAITKLIQEHKSDNQIRNNFNNAMLNRDILAKQFTHDWLRYLSKHKDLANKTYNANNSVSLLFYNKLFQQLAIEFCSEHDIPIDNINVKILQNWYDYELKEQSKKLNKNKTLGFVLFKNKSDITNKFTSIELRLSFDAIKNACRTEKVNLFNYMLAAFAHEMNHILDEVQPRHGSVGPQIMEIDSKIYVNGDTNKKEYSKSATEISSFTIQDEIIRQLKQYIR